MHPERQFRRHRLRAVGLGTRWHWQPALGAYRGDALAYVGSVGTGFKDRDALDLRRMLDKLKTKRAPVAVDKKGIVFVEPTLIAEIEYRAWTDDGKLRHASYKGLRDVQDNAAIYRLGE